MERKKAALSTPFLAAATLCSALACGGKAAMPAVPVQDCSGGQVWHQDDGARFRGCSKVRGSLELGGALQSAADFAALREVEGDLVIGPSYQMNDLAALAGLVKVHKSLLVRSNMRLGGLFLGGLSEVGGRVEISGNSELRRVSLHALTTIGGTLAVGEANRSLEAVDLGALQLLGGAQLEIDWQKARPEAVLRAPVY